MVIAQSETFEVLKGDDNTPKDLVHFGLSELREIFSTREARDEGDEAHQNTKHLLIVIDPQLTVLLDFQLAREDLGLSLL